MYTDYRLICMQRYAASPDRKKGAATHSLYRPHFHITTYSYPQIGPGKKTSDSDRKWQTLQKRAGPHMCMTHQKVVSNRSTHFRMPVVETSNVHKILLKIYFCLFAPFNVPVNSYRSCRGGFASCVLNKFGGICIVRPIMLQ